jgi:hypothetical protein
MSKRHGWEVPEGWKCDIRCFIGHWKHSKPSCGFPDRRSLYYLLKSSRITPSEVDRNWQNYISVNMKWAWLLFDDKAYWWYACGFNSMDGWPSTAAPETHWRWRKHRQHIGLWISGAGVEPRPSFIIPGPAYAVERFNLCPLPKSSHAHMKLSKTMGKKMALVYTPAEGMTTGFEVQA